MQAAELSVALLSEVRSGRSAKAELEALRQLDPALLSDHLPEQDHRLVFWLHLYNAYFQILVRRDPGLFRQRHRLFTSRYFEVAGSGISLDDMEHGMLRRGAFKYGLGYVHHPWPNRFFRRLRVQHMDPRVHFAMNCGARSCPPIRFYSLEDIHAQLDLATRAFLSQEVHYDARTDTAEITALFSWFRGDFGGLKGVRSFLVRYAGLPDTKFRIRFRRYDWSAAFDNFA